MAELDVVKKMQKKYGEGAVVRMDSAKVEKIEAIPTGSLLLDYAIGIGGVPRGRIIEVYGMESSGKTTVCLQTAAEAQKMSMNVAYIDVENALDIFYAKRLGVDIEKLYISQPDSAEEALDIVENYVRSGDFGLIIIDSIAALVPRAENEGEMGSQFIGLQARLMSQAMRKLQAQVRSSNTTLLFVNQIRMKIGVMYGCLHADTMIPLSDGRKLTIREIVDNEVDGEIWSLDESNNTIVSSKITGWHNNGSVDSSRDYIHIETTSINGAGRFGVTATPDHLVLSNGEWVKSSDIKIGDNLTSKYTQIVNGSLKNFLNGTMVGDCHIAINSRNTGAIKIRDNENIEYTNWKIGKLSPFFTFTESKVNSGVMYCSNYLYEIARIRRDLGRRDPLYFLKNFSKLGLAIWFMDDVHFDNEGGHSRYILSIKRIKNTPKMQEVKSAFEALGYPCSMNVKDGNFSFSSECTYRIASDICEYIPECMQYKLPEKYRGKYKDFKLENNPVIVSDDVEVVMIRNASQRQMRQKGKYDITVDGCHNYFAGGVNNGVLVHNSPETTPGGNAMKFAASVRIKLTRSNIKKGDEVVGSTIKARIEKNKVAVPFRVCEMEIIFNEGINKMAELVDLGVQFEFITKRGAFYSIDDTKLGQGKEAAKSFLKENPEIAAKLEAQIRGHMAKTQTGLVLDSGDDEIEVDEATGEIL